jgi:hypothetical protein
MAMNVTINAMQFLFGSDWMVVPLQLPIVTIKLNETREKVSAKRLLEFQTFFKLLSNILFKNLRVRVEQIT